MTKQMFKVGRVKGAPVSDEELIADLKRVAELAGVDTLSMKLYKSAGGVFDCGTIARRFGSWSEALKACGVSAANEIDITDERLFENLLALWQHFGRQPRRRELASPPSTVSQSPYNRRFGSWVGALNAFVDYANGTAVEAPQQDDQLSDISNSAGRDPSLRLRWRVLKRDRFTCCACGASPAITPGVELHIDHIVPWSKGGQTTLENLQSLCSTCNLGKSNTE
jgi:hypothetical protein